MATTRFIHDRGLTARMTLAMFLLGGCSSCSWSVSASSSPVTRC